VNNVIVYFKANFPISDNHKRKIDYITLREKRLVFMTIIA